MSDSQVIARKFRPKTFDQVVGQEAITRTLSNALTTGRLHHAYLFTGARGVGKTTTARIFAKALNCVKGITTEPCDLCASCGEIAASSSMDVHEIDAASHTQVENVREVILNTVGIAPARDRFKIFIIDEVHMLSNSSFNALLKTLEEPPSHVVFIMATTELQKVPETILSRCQVFEFRTISLRKIFDQLRHIADNLGVKISDTALSAIARAGEGSMRDAESALDQVISFAGQNISDEDVSAALGLVDVETLNSTIRAIADQDAGQILRIVEQVVSRGYDLRNFCREMIVHTRALLVIKIAGFDTELVQLPQSEGEALTRLAASFSEQDLVRFFSILTKTEQDIRTSSQSRFQLEIGLMKLVHARRLYLLEDALGQIAELQSRLGVAALPASALPASGLPASSASSPQASGPRGVGKSGVSTLERPAEGGAVRRKPAGPANLQGAEMAPRGASRVSQPAAPPLPPEPPHLLDAPNDYDLDPPASDAQSNALPGLDGAEAVQKIIAALEARNKMLIAMALEKAKVEIDGEFLRVLISPANARDKTQMDGRDKRQAIEEAAKEVLGRRLTLSVSVGAESRPDGEPKGKEATKVKEKVDTNPRVKALADKFRAESIEIIKPEG
jgi:DNA polymerase III subunit gamma/tau